MLPIRNISYLLPMCCSFWEKCKNSPKTSLGCSTPLIKIMVPLYSYQGRNQACSSEVGEVRKFPLIISILVDPKKISVVFKSDKQKSK